MHTIEGARPFMRAVARTAMVCAVAAAVPCAAWAARRDRTPPTAPGDLRVTQVTPYSVTLAWAASTDNSGRLSYVVCCAQTQAMSAPQGATSLVFTAGLEPRRSYTLRAYAVDAAGNHSRASNPVSFTLPADTTPPTRPIVSVTGTGPTHVSLMWSSVEDGPNVWYSVFVNGDPIMQGTRNTAANVSLLEPESTYTFTVQARDFAANWSPASDPVRATTAASNAEDVTPPSTPENLREQSWDCEVELAWDEATDDLDPQWLIEYEVHVNGVHDHSLSQRRTRTIVYGTHDGPNTFTVVAVDTAGNRADPATVVADLACSR